MKDEIYLDYMATTPVDPRVRDEMMKYLSQEGVFANPSSVNHQLGRQALQAVEHARQQVADLLVVEPEEIIFTSCATESINLAQRGAVHYRKHKGKHIVTMASEHKAVLASLQYLETQGYEIDYLKPQANGLLDIDEFKNTLRDDTILTSVMWVNNEVGVIQDIAAIADICDQRGILLHVDAVQAAGKINVDISESPIDLLSISAHKVYGPKGIGALYIRNKPRVRIQPLLYGGSQEQGLRAGTLATHQIMGMGKACEIAASDYQQESQRIKTLQQQFLTTMEQIGGIHLNGDAQARVANNINIVIDGVDAEALMAMVPHIAFSAGSACNTVVTDASHVLKSMGLSDQDAYSSLRFSLGRFTTVQEIQQATTQLIGAINHLRCLSPLWKG